MPYTVWLLKSTPLVASLTAKLYGLAVDLQGQLCRFRFLHAASGFASRMLSIAGGRTLHYSCITKSRTFAPVSRILYLATPIETVPEHSDVCLCNLSRSLCGGPHDSATLFHHCTSTKKGQVPGTDVG
jgi:hypothetical protein